MESAFFVIKYTFSLKNNTFLIHLSGENRTLLIHFGMELSSIFATSKLLNR